MMCWVPEIEFMKKNQIILDLLKMILKQSDPRLTKGERADQQQQFLAGIQHKLRDLDLTQSQICNDFRKSLSELVSYFDIYEDY